MALPEVADWTQLIQLMGQYAGTPTLVALDANGNIIAVLKGEYAGTLKTLATTAEGYLIAVLSDPEDVAGVFRQMGLAELSARRNLAFAYDRRGDVIWYTNFENGLEGSSFDSDHADSVGSLSSSRAFTGGLSIKLDPRAAADSYVDWDKVLHYLSTGTVGFGVMISIDADPDLFRLWISHFDGTNQLQARLTYDPQTGNWQIYDNTPGYQTILSGFTLQTGPTAWHPIKLVIDTTTEKYVRALIGKNEVDLSAYALYKVASASLGQLFIEARCYGAVATAAPIYVDSILVTQNEPA